MVFLVRNHPFLEKKMVFGGLLLVKPSFPREKDCFFEGWLLKTIFFSRKRWFRTKKPSFSRENQRNQKKQKTKKKKKINIFWRPQPHSFGKDGFFWIFLFSREKDGFLVRNHLFLEKKMVLSNHPSKNHLFLEKRMVSNQKKPSFSRENKKKPSFGGPSPIVFGIDGFFGFFGFLEKKRFFGSKPSLSREKDGFEQPSFEKTISLSRIRWF